MTSASRRACATLARPGSASVMLGRRVMLSVLSMIVMMLSLSACKRDAESDKPGAHHYDDKQAALASFEEPERDAWAMPGRVVEALGVTPRMDVADIGAGSGYFTRRLATAAHEGTTYAVDVDADFKGYIEAHREQWGTSNIVTRLAVYEHPLLPRDTVDLVFISNTYSFLQDRESYFTAVYKALRRGGRLAVIDWRDDVDCPRYVGCPKPGQRIPNSVARAELESVGFKVLETHDFLTYQYFMILGRAVDQVKVVPEPATPPVDPVDPVDDAMDADSSADDAQPQTSP